MLNYLRRAVKSWVAKILLALLILSFAVWGIGDIFTGTTGRTVALVGDTEVSGEQFARAIQRTQTLMMRQSGEPIDLAALREAGLDRRELATLIRDATFSEELSTLEIAVPAEAVRDTIGSNPNFLDDQGNFSQFRYQSVLGENGYTPGDFEQLTRALLAQQILRDAIAPDVTAPPGVAEAIAAWQGETRSLRTVTLPATAAADPGEPDDAALQAYFEANSDDFIEPERRWGRYLHIDIGALTAEMVPTPDEVRAEYDASPDAFTVTPTRTVEQIVFDTPEAAADAAKRIADGTASYEEIAVEQNLTLESLTLGTVTQDDLPEATAEAVFALTEPGIAGPVEGPFGHALLNVTNVVIGGLRPFEEVRDQIIAVLTARRAEEAAPERANQIDDLRAGGISLEEIATETGLPLLPLDGLDPRGIPAEGPPPAVAADPRFLREVTEAIDGEERDIIQLSDGGYALVTIDRIVESHLPELESIRDRVVEAWKLEQRLAALETRIAAMIETSTADLGALAAEPGATAEEVAAFPRGAAPRTLSDELVDAVFGATRGGVVSGRSRDGRSVIVARVTTVTPLEDGVLSELTARTADGIGQSLTLDHLQYFSQALQDRHGARINEEAIDSIFEQLGGQVGG